MTTIANIREFAWRTPWRWVFLGAQAFVTFAATLDVLNLTDDFEEFSERLGWDGQTFRVELVNDTRQPLTLRVCVDDDCDDLGKTVQVASGGSYPTAGKVGDQAVWQATDAQGNILGCFDIPFDRRYRGLQLRASALASCPKK